MHPVTLKQFRDKNQDVLLEELKPDDLHGLGCGTVLFCVTTEKQARPKPARHVCSAGYMLLVNKYSSDMDRPAAFLVLDNNGHAELRHVYPADIGPDGNYALYRTRPVDVSDTRDTWDWHLWT